MDILLFGITKDIIGKQKLTLNGDENIADVAGLKQWLYKNFPAIKELSSLAIAVDNEYAGDNQSIGKNSEIALLPPVSGG